MQETLSTLPLLPWATRSFECKDDRERRKMAIRRIVSMRRTTLVSLTALFLAGSLALGQSNMTAQPKELDLSTIQCGDKGSQTTMPDAYASRFDGGCCGHGGGCGQAHGSCGCHECDPWTGFYAGIDTGMGIGLESTTLNSS